MKTHPKQKAKEIFDSMMKDFQYCFNKEISKCHALIAVNLILNDPLTFDEQQIKYSDGSYAREYVEIPNIYWTKVK